MRANPLQYLGHWKGVGPENLLSHVNSRYINSNIIIKCGTSSVFFIYSFAMRLLSPKFVTVSIVNFSDYYICSRKFKELAKTNFFIAVLYVPYL
jgi:hypothetical protein